MPRSTSRSRQLAKLFETNIVAVSNGELTSGSNVGGGGGVTTYATIDNLPLSGNTAGDQAFVTGSDRLYIWDGSGWYNIALINTNPSFDSNGSPNASYDFTDSSDTVTITLAATDPEGIPITYSAIRNDSADDFFSILQTTTTNTGDTFVISARSLDSIISNGYDSAFSGTFDITFRASDGVNLATALSEFTITFQGAITDSKYTTLLLKSVGANNGTNSNLTDASTNNHTITEYGDVHAGTFSPYSSRGYSAYMNGGDRYTLSSSADWNLGNDWTIEGWFYPTATPTQVCRILMFGTNNTANALSLSLNTSLEWGADIPYSGGTPVVTSQQGYLNQWQHVAWVRNSSTNTGTVYVNGVSTASTSSPGVQAAGDVPLYIGYDVVNTVAYQFRGYIADLRITKSALYNSNFTPSSERLTSSDVLANTKLLTFSTPYLKDLSASNHAISITGDPSLVSFSPYDYSEYSSSVNGGSIYFDGVDDYVSVASSSDLMLNTSFTIEFWTYMLSGDGGGYNAVSFYQMGEHNFRIDGASDGTSLKLIINQNDTVLNVTSGINLLNSWHHIAYSYDGTTIKLFVDGVQKGSATRTINQTAGPNNLAIGINTASVGTVFDYKGYISDLRHIRGTALYTTDFTPPTAPLTAITNTSLLINGTDGSIIDYSGSRNVTLDGNTKSSTAVTKYGSSSIAFDGTGDRIIADEPLLPANEDFTYEAWLYLPSVSVKQAIVSQYLSTDGGRLSFDIGNTNSGQLNFFFAGTGNIASSAGAVSANTWHHVAYTREGNTFRGFLDGTLVGSATSSQAIYQTNTAFGVRSDLLEHFTGYMEDIRITRGLARYTANFTPPTAGLKG